MLRSHNGVHCCGTVGDSHSHSQLSTAKCTFTGDSFQNHAAKVRISEQNTKFYLRIFEQKYLRRSQRYILFLKERTFFILILNSWEKKVLLRLTLRCFKGYRDAKSRCWRCQVTLLEMSGHGVADASYGGIVGITDSVSRHPLLSWKASE